MKVSIGSRIQELRKREGLQNPVNLNGFHIML